MSQIADKHVLITGGGSGVGAELAQSFAAQNARVTIMGRRLSALEETAKSHPNILPVAADITDPEALQTAFETARAKNGGIDIVIANAGAATSAPFDKTSLELWNQTLAVNLTGTFLTIQHAYEDMKKSGWGRVIAIASTAGLKGYSYVTPYCAAKHGVVGMVKALALETARKDITANAICPGFIETPMLADSIANIMEKTGRSEEEARASLMAGNPQKRFIQPSEIVATAKWLCEAGSESITGQALSISGGEI